jgi:hypothetical protein
MRAAGAASQAAVRVAPALLQGGARTPVHHARDAGCNIGVRAQTTYSKSLKDARSECARWQSRPRSG